MQVHYARSGDVNIAYSVVGEGPIDIVNVTGWVLSFESYSEMPISFDPAARMTSVARVISFDRRGTGLSDRTLGVPTLEERADDLRAVMDSAGSERAALVGYLDGTIETTMFAAMYPDRTRALVSWGPFTAPPDLSYPQETIDAIGRHIEEWGQGAILRLVAPTMADDPDFRDWYMRAERIGATPATAAAHMRSLRGLDMSDVTAMLRVPTLVLTRPQAPIMPPVTACRWVAEHIRGAKYVELDGVDGFPFLGDADAVFDEIEEFVTGARPAPEAERVLSTVLFTDIVGSTSRAENLGDHRWRRVLEDHDATIRRELGRFRGNEVKHTGDGFLATFDGPARAVRCGLAIAQAAPRLGIGVRTGVHTGEVEVRGGDVAGIAVHIASRVADLADPGEVLVSRTVTDLVAGSGLTFADCGERELKGVSGSWRIYSATDRQLSEALRPPNPPRSG